MILWNEVELKLEEPTVKEYRQLLEYIHFSSDGAEIKNRYYKLLSVVSTIYRNQITATQLQAQVDSGTLLIRNPNKPEEESVIPHNDVMFLQFGEWLIGERLKEITNAQKGYYPLMKLKSSTKKSGATVDSIETIRWQLSEWYKAVVVKGQIMSWNEMDALTISEFEAFKDTLTSDTNKGRVEVEIITNDDLMAELGVEVF